MKKNKLILFILFTIPLVLITPFSYAQILKEASQEYHSILDDPIIRNFSLSILTDTATTSAAIIAGSQPQMTLSWQVGSTPEGTPITGIRIEETKRSGAGFSVTSLNPRGSYSFRPTEGLPAGKIIYTLTATNSAGHSKSATVTLEILTIEQVIEKINLDDITIHDTSDQTSFNVHLEFSNSSDISTSLGVTIWAFGGGEWTAINKMGSVHPEVFNFPAGKTMGANIICRFPDTREWTRVKVSLSYGTEKDLRVWEFPLISEVKRIYRVAR